LGERSSTGFTIHQRLGKIIVSYKAQGTSTERSYGILTSKNELYGILAGMGDLVLLVFLKPG
jgi:hypothetical protein